MTRDMRVIDSGRVIGYVQFDGGKLKLGGMAALILGRLRDGINNDDQFGADLIKDGWMNQAVELGPARS
jgi:hypothetical protein